MLLNLKIKRPSLELLAIAFGLIIVATLIFCERKVRAWSGDQELNVAASFAGKEFVRPDEQIELTLNRAIKESEGRLAILIGDTDVSSLFARERLRLRYNAKLWPLPLGESTLVIYLVAREGEWKEIARFELRVAKEKLNGTDSNNELTTRFVNANYSRPEILPLVLNEDEAALQQTEPSPKPSAKKRDAGKVKFVPSLTITIKSQPAQSSFPDSARPARPTFTDTTIQATLNNEMSHGIFSSQSNFDFAGSSFQQEALRFGTLGNDAPKIDLASYLIQFKTGRVKYQIGHFSYGAQRQLINGFSSRGIMITVPLTRRLDFSASAMNGTQVVGYNNFFGLAKRKHQLLSGTLGFEFLPKRPGALRLEVGVLSGYVQPLSGFNRGTVNDTERSRGLAVRLIASDKAGRFRLDTGFTRTLFISPNDNLLNQGANVVTIPPLRRGAHYLDVSYDVLKDFSLTKSRKANLTLAFREETVAPLFRSLGASTQADKTQYEISSNGSVGEINAQFSYVGFHDNLKNIPSILKSLTRSLHASIALPMSALFSGRLKKSPWLPRLGYSFDRLHQFGARIPVGGGFEIDLTSIPNLFGTNETFSADWQVKKFTFGYNFNHSYQDNQQRGRESADQGVFANSGRFGFALGSRFNLNIDLSAESSANKETGRIDRNYRLGPGITWQLTKHIGLSANLSNTIAGDKANTTFNRSTDFDSALTYRFNRGEKGLKKMAVQLFVRYSNHYEHALERLFLVNNLRRNQTLTLNLGFTFF